MHNRSLVSNYKEGKHLKFYLYLNDVKGFYPYIQEIKTHLLRFKSSHKQKAEKILSSLPHDIIDTSSMDVNESSPEQKKLKIVSIHIRLGDYGPHLKGLFDLELVDTTYFTRAMSYVVERDPVSQRFFLITSNNPKLVVLIKYSIHF